jgi:hypothetical protein
MIKTALLHTIRLIEDYQSHCQETYSSVETELDSLKDHMKEVMNCLEGGEFDDMEILQPITMQKHG